MRSTASCWPSFSTIASLSVLASVSNWSSRSAVEPVATNVVVVDESSVPATGMSGSTSVEQPAISVAVSRTPTPTAADRRPRLTH
ncbi:MAG TPA: hypothetical protein VFP09_13435 [Desertimonas sp.]|nr:hypothetical protein [Desertimonas sp.]